MACGQASEQANECADESTREMGGVDGRTMIIKVSLGKERSQMGGGVQGRICKRVDRLWSSNSFSCFWTTHTPVKMMRTSFTAFNQVRVVVGSAREFISPHYLPTLPTLPHSLYALF